MSTRAPEVVRVAERVVGKPAVTWERPECGLTVAHRYAVRFADGTAVFVKGAADDQTAEFLRTEHATLKTVGGTLGPAILHWLPGERPILITEHLPHYWPSGTGRTVWRAGDVDAVHAALTELRTVAPPADMPPTWWPDPIWRQLVDDPALIDAGLCPPEWLTRHGGLIVETDERARARTDCVVHGDVRSDNLCILPDGRATLVDWSSSGAGHPLQDLIMFLPTARLESGGPDPATVLQGEVETVTRLAGPSVQRAIHFSDGPDWLGRVLRDVAVINLDWIATLLDLEPPSEFLGAARDGATTTSG